MLSHPGDGDLQSTRTLWRWRITDCASGPIGRRT